MRAGFGSVCAAIVWGVYPPAAMAAPQWEVLGTVLDGRQFAAVADDDVVHVIGERYLQIDAAGAVVVDETDVGDERQGSLDFYPAVAVAGDGSVHVVTRHGGDFDTGHEIRYARRAPGGGWDPAVVVGSPVGRNYVVGVAVPSGGRVVVTHSHAGADVGSTIDIYELSDGAATPIGSTSGGWVRADNDYRLMSSGTAVILAAGDPWPDGSTHVGFAADAGGDLASQWDASKVSLSGGTGRRGGPDVHVDSAGDVHVLHGAESTLHYAHFSADGAAVGGESQAMDDLGTWHLSHGNGAIVASADGARILVVGLQNLDGDQTAADSDVLWVESTDGGATFSDPTALGMQSDGGEGRQRPRMVRLGDTVLLLLHDAAADAIGLAVADWSDDDPGGSTSAGDDSGTSAGDDEAGGPSGDPMGTGDGGDGPSATGSGGTGDGSLDPIPPSGRSGGSGCGCRSDAGPPPWVALLGLLGLGRRRRRPSARS